jgi:hypothetical protein
MTGCDTAVTSCVAASRILEVSDTSSVTTLHHRFTSSGTYYLGVDGVGGECGDFHLTGRLRGPTTAVDDEPHDGAFPVLRVSPNPTRGAVLLSGRLPALGARVGTITMFDAAGRRVWRGAVRANGGVFLAMWDRRLQDGSLAPSGTYLLRARFGSDADFTGRVTVLD